MKEKIKNDPERLRALTSFPFNCAGGDDIGKLQRSQPITFVLLSGRTACRWKYDCYFPFSVVLPYSVFLIHLKFYTTITCGCFFFISKRTKPVLLRPYLPDLDAPDKISTIPTPYHSRVQLSQAPRFDYHFSTLLTKLKHKVPGYVPQDRATMKLVTLACISLILLINQGICRPEH